MFIGKNKVINECCPAKGLTAAGGSLFFTGELVYAIICTIILAIPSWPLLVISDHMPTRVKDLF